MSRFRKGFLTRLRSLHEPLPNRKSAILLRSSAGVFHYVFRLSVVSLFETIEGMGKPEERHFVTAVLAGVSVCSVLL